MIRQFIIALVMGCAAYTASAQQAAPATAAQASANGPGEKLFVHTDKDFYVTGEIIWFKVYAADVATNKPLSLSKVAYVEILSKDNKSVLQAKIAMEDATGNGSFLLPYSVGSGNYVLRAYTNWMKNDGNEAFFEKAITIVNTMRQPEWPAEQPNTPPYEIGFFPEGGDMIAGVTGKIAFRIAGRDNKGVEANGTIVNDRNEVVARFSTTRFGMGHFDLAAKAGENYTAVLQLPNGKQERHALPAVKQNGIALRVQDAPENKIAVQLQGTVSGRLSVVVRGINRTVVNAAAELVNGTAAMTIDKPLLGDGISVITVRDASGAPLAERLYFRKPRTVSLDVVPDAKQYAARNKVTLDLRAPASIDGSYSIAVYQLDGLQGRQSTDILSYYWLQSEIKGSIEDPAFYFSDDPDAEKAADDLMLTQGWRRFRWQRTPVNTTNSISFLPELEGHLVYGRVADKRSGRPAPNATAYLSVPAEKALFTPAISDAQGNLVFNLKNFYGGTDIVVQTNPLTDSMLRVDVTSPFSDQPAYTHLPLFTLEKDKSAVLTTHSIQSQIGSAYYTDKQQRFLFPSAIDTMPFYGNPDRRYYLDDYTRFITMEEVMREFVSDVRVRKSDDRFSYRVRNTDFNTFFETDPLVLVDGVPVFNADKVMNFDPLKIKRVDVVSHRFFQHKQMHDGILSYSTYQGDLAGFPLDANALIVSYPGMQLQREFYSPVYDTPEQRASRMPDMRSLLYWSPDARPGAKTSFFTSDTEGQYLVVLQGLTSDGRPGVAYTTFSVTK